MNIKKLLILSLVLILIGTVAFGCGGPEEDYEDIIEEEGTEENGESMEDTGESESGGGDL